MSVTRVALVGRLCYEGQSVRQVPFSTHLNLRDLRYCSWRVEAEHSRPCALLSMLVVLLLRRALLRTVYIYINAYLLYLSF